MGADLGLLLLGLIIRAYRRCGEKSAPRAVAYPRGFARRASKSNHTIARACDLLRLASKL